MSVTKRNMWVRATSIFDRRKTPERRYFWESKYFARQLLIDTLYLVGIPIIWSFTPASILGWAVYIIVAPLMVYMTIRMHQRRKRHFQLMTAMFIPFERTLKRETEPGWRDCQLCGQKKMCVNCMDKWMCEHCYGDFHKYWQANNPYAKSWWPYKI